jgi:hypothetical protein
MHRYVQAPFCSAVVAKSTVMYQHQVYLVDILKPLKRSSSAIFSVTVSVSVVLFFVIVSVLGPFTEMTWKFTTLLLAILYFTISSFLLLGRLWTMVGTILSLFLSSCFYNVSLILYCNLHPCVHCTYSYLVMLFISSTIGPKCFDNLDFFPCTAVKEKS